VSAPQRQSAPGLLARARALEASDPLEAATYYHQARLADPACLEAHNALERLGSVHAYGKWMRVDSVIDERDDIYRFFEGHEGVTNPIRDYLADGWRTLSELMLLLDREGKPLTGVRSMLEFASGFGRFTRHLVRVLPGRVTCCDVLPGSTDFVRERFGVQAFDSQADPASIAWPGRYDLIFILSFFTHVPLQAWPKWLARFDAALEEDGLLVFSIHSPEYAMEHNVKFDDRGGAFLRSSEQSALSTEEYGTTFATWERVRREIEAGIPGAQVEIHPRTFWVAQDAVVVRRRRKNP